MSLKVSQEVFPSPLTSVHPRPQPLSTATSNLPVSSLLTDSLGPHPCALTGGRGEFWASGLTALMSLGDLLLSSSPSHPSPSSAAHRPAAAAGPSDGTRHVPRKMAVPEPHLTRGVLGTCEGHPLGKVRKPEKFL